MRYNGAKLPEGAYSLRFWLKDVFGNEHSRDAPVKREMVVLGNRPAIACPCTGDESGPCTIRDRGCPFRVEVTDESGIVYLRFEAVDAAGEKRVFECDPVTAQSLKDLDGAHDEIGLKTDEVFGRVTHVTIDYRGLSVGSEEKITVLARDDAGDDPRRAAELLCWVKCETEELPPVVEHLGIEWVPVERKYGDAKEIFWISRSEISRGFFREHDRRGVFREAPEWCDEDPMTNIAPEEMERFAGDLGCYLPAHSQWRYVATGAGSYGWVLDPNDPTDLRDVTYCRESYSVFKDEVCKTEQKTDASRLLPVDHAPAALGALAAEHKNIFCGTIHILGNAAETVVADDAPADAPNRFKRVGGDYAMQLRACRESAGMDVPRDARYSRLGFRLVIYHTTWKTPAGVVKTAVPEFEEKVRVATERLAAPAAAGGGRGS